MKIQHIKVNFVRLPEEEPLVGAPFMIGMMREFFTVQVQTDEGIEGIGVTAFGDSAHECCPTDVHVVRRGVPGGGTVHLDVDVGAGHADITRRRESLRATS